MQDVLVLNKHYMPVAFTTWDNAVKLWYEGVAKIIREDTSGNLIRSQHLTMAVPRVIVVNNYWKRKKKKSVPCSKRNLLIRDNSKCQYCGTAVNGEAQIEHVVPECQGGKKTWTNAVIACPPCNSRKGGKTPEQAGMKLLREPQAPKPDDNRFVHRLQTRRIRPEWQEWSKQLYTQDSLED